jgi:dimethylamine/trimethylamine dehydrogenase
MRYPQHDALFESISFGPKTMPNRFWVSSHASGLGSERPGAHAAYRGVRAEGGWGAVCTEFCSIHPQSDEYPSIASRLWDEGDVINQSHVTEEIHKHKALAGVQLWYGGVHSRRYESRETASGPSSLPSSILADRNVYAARADDDDIRAIINMYVLAARRAEQAGFDIVEVLCGDNTVPMQFLERRSNRRTDRYGGSLENRARFFLELMSAVKRAVGDRVAVTSRFEIDTLDGEEGIGHRDDGLAFLEVATREGVVDLWSLKIGNFGEFGADVGSSRFYRSNWTAPFLAGATEITNVPIVSNGRFTSPDDMVAALRSRQCDIIGAARPSIADPFLPQKIADGRLDEIRECIGCNMCVGRFEQQGLVYCTQNPTVGEEYRRGWHPETFTPAGEAKTVLIVGAGPAGLECALTLGRRGHIVHLRDSADALGGHWRRVSKLPRCGEYERLVSYREVMLSKLDNVEVHLGIAEMTVEDVLEYGAEQVVIATGSTWSPDGLTGSSSLAVPGLDASRPDVFTPEQVLRNVDEVHGNNVVILDGDGHFMGFAMAELMAARGKSVTIVTNMPEVSPHANYTGEMADVKRAMRAAGIAQVTDSWVREFDRGIARLRYLYADDSALSEVAQGRWGRREGDETVEIPCDALILVTGREPNDSLYHGLKGARDRWEAAGIDAVYRIGDAVHPRHAMDAVFDGHRLGREFDSANPQQPLPFIRERQLWGQETIPKLGDSRPVVEGPLLA